MNLSLIGLQWGDEGKGKIIDFFSNFSNLIIRYNGGHNAGHTIYKNNKKKIIKILPSGVFKKYCISLLSNNIYILIENLLKEIKINFNNIFISKNVFIINKIDEFIDFLIDKIIKIGTTFNGISIINLRKSIKCSFNIRNIFCLYFLKILKKNLFFYNIIFIFFKIKLKIFLFFLLKKIKIMIEIIKKNIVNNNYIINFKINKIFESAQGVMLDFNNGTFPFVTNSNIINKSIFINSNFYLNNLKFIGIIKSFSTRVGNGNLNTKLNKKKNFFFSYINKEFGTNSLRLRNSGWNDLFLLKEMIKINNISNLILTKMDSLITIKYIKLLINYNINKIKFFNYKNNFFKNNYFIFNSWKKINLKYFKNEKNFHLYIRFIEKVTNTSIIIISIGKNEKDLIFL
ncbi:adenylosuccinate synthetase [Candidatus Carsonella ruddii]|uniref:Adenylosuccinate synthetase n=1 Tax=Candidatus Carsonella ruddii HC isolate Thao2000 TaxID=1202538 RepID=J3YPY3_CARRU|nr:adenylosuccinate synthetase [Candidatus Carsonella ruddii]AFP83888.1 adenylosuccinate synthase [Candidatus Carsonella ruddii HC isolate Thao2000]